MRNNLLLLALFTLFTTTAFGQIQSAQGKLILTNGQELNGTITHFYDLPSEIILLAPDNTKRNLLPAEVAEIQLSDSRRFLLRDLNSERLVFQLLIGSEKLILLKRETPSPEFYIAKEEQLHKLENNEETLLVNGKRYKKEDNSYIGILNVLMHDRLDLNEKIHKEQDLTALVLAYTSGNVTYYYQPDAKLERKPYWVAYAQYSNYYRDEITTGHSFGYQAGAQYYFSSAGRNSLRFGLDYGNYTFERADIKTYMLTIAYQYDFVKTSKMNAYLMATFFGFGYSEYHDLERNEDQDVYGAAIRIAPGLGFEYRSTEKLSLYAEVNELFVIEGLPKNYSLGIKYAFRK
ncbi:hypothetical protein JAO76_09950 [Pontibacter sp. BT310]|uniref:Porin family protein n=1 Tax=Pontibacter populi TaxID=890055 RepID=A0ABS6XBK2_9BACT|nr:MULTISPECIES: hypothetical protein [Pontibacter]MBJ6118514.1 hypothetical protein [Pontibacter sp. BT310]MBR0570943.1 hypothetical protein [Microvirga sp. STS03]MBW3365368.1 porin family protein [Pontibacter populi]